MPTPSTIDETRLAALAKALGPARVTVLMAMLRERLEGFSAALAAPDAAMAPRAAGLAVHQLRGAAGSLGLAALEAALAGVEQRLLALDTLEIPSALTNTAASLLALHATAMTEVTRLLPTAAPAHGDASNR